MRKLFFGLSLFALFFVTNARMNPQTPAMQSFSSPEGRFTVTFPPNTSVATNTDSIPFKDGTKGDLYEFTVELDADNVAYMVLYSDYRSDQANVDPQTQLENTRNGAVQGKTLLSDLTISLNGVPGHAFTAKDDKWNYSVRQFLKGKRLYQLIVVSKPDHPAIYTDQFMNSFQIW